MPGYASLNYLFMFPETCAVEMREDRSYYKARQNDSNPCDNVNHVPIAASTG